MQSSHIYPGAHSISTYITVKGCNDAIEFYKKAFGAIEKGRLTMPDGTIAHAEIEIEGSLMMLADENLEWGNKSPLTIGGNPMTLGLYVVDVNTSFKRAVDAGAEVVMPIEEMFYGDKLGQVMDPFGYKWMIITHIKTMSFEEMQNGYDKLLAEEQKSK